MRHQALTSPDSFDSDSFPTAPYGGVVGKESSNRMNQGGGQWHWSSRTILRNATKSNESLGSRGTLVLQGREPWNEGDAAMPVIEKPIYSQQQTPEGAVLIGTLYLDPTTGIVYRLRGYYPDWSKLRSSAGSSTELPKAPSYSALTPSGAQTSVEAGDLPEAASKNVIWVPEEPNVVLTWTALTGEIQRLTQPERAGYESADRLGESGVRDVDISWAA